MDAFLAGPRAWNHWRETNPEIIPDLKNLRPTLNQRQMGSVSGGPVNLRAALLQDAFLRYATLSNADLKDANLTDADVAYARLDNANLKNANLTNAVLDHTDFSNAVLSGVIIRGASLKQALNLTQEQINRCVGDAETVLPEYVDRPASWSKSPNPPKSAEAARESAEAASETIPLVAEYGGTGALAISRRAKAIGVGLVLVPLSALVWNFFAAHETLPSPSPTKVATVGVPDALPAKTAMPDAINVIAPNETAAVPPRPVEWMSETVHGGHAISNADSVYREETHAIAALDTPQGVPESRFVPPVATLPLEPDRVEPITATPDALPSGSTVPEPSVAAPKLPQKETAAPAAPAPTQKSKKTKTAAKPAPVAKRDGGGAISDLLAGGL